MLLIKKNNTILKDMIAFENSLRHSFGIEGTDDLKYVTSLFEPKLLKKGEVFLEEGRNCDKLCFVQSGFLRIFTETEDKQITQWIAPHGYFVTDLSGFIFEKMSRWTIEALTDTQLFYIHKREYKKINITIPQWSELERQFIVHCFTTLEDRIFSHLSMTAEQRYHFFFQYNKELFHQVPLQYIASMLGMTPETFSRIRKKQ